MMRPREKARYLHRVPAIAAAVLIAAGTVASRAETGAGEESAEAIARMRGEIDELRAQLESLRNEVAALRAAAAPPGPAAATPSGSGEPAVVTAQPPAGGPRGAGATAFNPAISAVFEGIAAASLNHDRDDDGFSLSEAEVGLQAAVDPYARVDLFLAFGAEGEAEVEEGFITFPALPGGLQAKAGRFKSAFGKWNELHDHRFFTVDRPDALTAFFGEEGLVADGASLSWLVPGAESTYLETITQIGSSGNDVLLNARRRDPLFLQRVDAVLTLTPGATLGLGASAAAGRAGPTPSLIAAIEDAGLTGVVEPSEELAASLFGADLTWKWKPLQSHLYRSLTWQTEALAGRRRVETLDPGGALSRDTVRSFGGYSLFEYQFARRWRAGIRFDRTQLPDDDAARVRSVSGILRIQPSEFQEFRVQFKHTGRNGAAAALFDDIRSDNELFIEWIPAIGAHAAHPY